MTAIQVKVDWSLCESYGVCVAAAPKVFDLNDDDDLVLLQERPDKELLAGVRDSMLRCPKRAISLVELQQ